MWKWHVGWRVWENSREKKNDIKIFLGLFFVLGIIFLAVTVIVKFLFEKKREDCTQIVEAIIVV